MIQRVVLIQGVTGLSGEQLVLCDGKALPPCPPPPFKEAAVYQWGWCSPGADSLARAILLAALGDQAAAQELAFDYMLHLVGKIQVANWTLPTSEVLAWVQDQARGRALLGRN